MQKLVLEALLEPVKVSTPRGQKKIPAGVATLLVLRNKALGGDNAAIRLLLPLILPASGIDVAASSDTREDAMRLLDDYVRRRFGKESEALSSEIAQQNGETEE